MPISTTETFKFHIHAIDGSIKKNVISINRSEKKLGSIWQRWKPVSGWPRFSAKLSTTSRNETGSISRSRTVSWIVCQSQWLNHTWLWNAKRRLAINRGWRYWMYNRASGDFDTIFPRFELPLFLYHPPSHNGTPILTIRANPTLTTQKWNYPDIISRPGTPGIKWCPPYHSGWWKRSLV